jgi:hypothetical protein
MDNQYTISFPIQIVDTYSEGQIYGRTLELTVWAKNRDDAERKFRLVLQKLLDITGADI